MIGDQFAEIINEKMTDVPMEQIGDVFIDKTKTDTIHGVQPSGQPFEGYADSTNKSDPVNLRDRSRSIETLYQQAREHETQLRFKGNAGYGKSSKPAGNVFDYHQYGRSPDTKPQVLPERRVFPESKDETSPHVQDAFTRVKDILARYFNE